MDRLRKALIVLIMAAVLAGLVYALARLSLDQRIFGEFVPASAHDPVYHRLYPTGADPLSFYGIMAGGLLLMVLAFVIGGGMIVALLLFAGFVVFVLTSIYAIPVLSAVEIFITLYFGFAVVVSVAWLAMEGNLKFWRQGRIGPSKTPTETHAQPVIRRRR